MIDLDISQIDKGSDQNRSQPSFSSPAEGDALNYYANCRHFEVAVLPADFRAPIGEAR